MNLIAGGNVLFGLVCFLSAWGVLRYARSSLAVAYSLLMLCTGYWQICTALTLTSESAAQALLWSRLAYLGALFIPIIFFELWRIAVDKRFSKIFHFLIYFATFIILGIFVYTDLLLDGVHKYSWGYWFRAGPWHFAFCCLYLIVLFFVPLFVLWKNRDFKSSEEARPQEKSARNLAFAFLIGNLGALDFLPNYGIDIFPLGFVFAIVSYVFVSLEVKRVINFKT
jgi:hypothetical protein